MAVVTRLQASSVQASLAERVSLYPRLRIRARERLHMCFRARERLWRSTRNSPSGRAQ